jgi:two-component system alkaline phosphatase synthesis response regulator PhoP
MNGSSAAERTLLIVDDEADLVELLQYNLEKEGFRTVAALDGIEGLKRAREDDPDLIILDIMMPGLGGVDVCRRIRREAGLREKPVIMLTARTMDQDYVEGLDAGADIYLGKPVSVPVLVSQVKALFRRAERMEHPPDVLNVHGIEINRDRYLVIQNDEEIRLPRKEFELLHFLGSHPGKVFSRHELLDAVWGQDVYVVDRTVDVHVRKIREKLGNDFIETVTGVGYKLRAH